MCSTYFRMARYSFLLSLCFLACIGIADSTRCSSSPKCFCTFDGKRVQIDPNTKGSEALAGTVGALSSMLVTGSGIGLWYFCKKRKWAKEKMNDTYARSASNLSSDSYTKEKPDESSQPYSKYPRNKPIEALRRGSVDSGVSQYASKPTNVYRGSVFEDRPLTVFSQYKSIASDWD